MAQEDIILKLDIDTGDSVNELEAVEKQFGKIDKQAEESGETIAAMTKKMELYKSAALKAGATSPIGKEAIQKAAQLQGELDKVNELVTRNNTDFDKFRSVVGISQTAINSYGAFQAVSAIVGVENEKLMETMVKLQAAQQLLNSLEGARSSLLQKNAVLTGGLAAVQKAYAFAVGTSSGALKVFRLALIATGIGALVVGLGLLIANFDKVSKWLKDLANRFELVGLIVKAVTAQIDMIKDALRALGILESEETERIKAMAEARVKAAADEEKAINSRYDFEIAKAQAAGKEVGELEQEKRLALIERIKAEAKAIVMLAKINGEFTDEQKERVKELGEQFKQIAQDTAIARIKEEKKVTDEFKKELDERAKAKDKASQDDAKRAAEDARLLQEAIDREDAQFDLMNELILSAQDLELQNLAKFYDEKFLLAEGNAELEKELRIKQAEDIAEIEANAAALKLEAEAEQAFALMALRIEMKELNAGELSDDASPEEIAAYYEARNEIETEQRDMALENNRNQLESGAITEEEFTLKKEIIEKKSSKNSKKLAEEETAFKKKLKDQEKANAIQSAGAILSGISSIAEEGSAIGKAAAIGQATMDTYKSAVAAYAAGSSVGGPAGLVLGPLAAGFAVAAGVKNVQKILSTKTPGNKGGGGASLPSMPSTGAVASVATIPDNPDGTLTENLLNPQGGAATPAPMKVVVLESDIKKATTSNEESVTTSQL